MRPFNALLTALLLFAGLGLFAAGNSAQQSGASDNTPQTTAPQRDRDEDSDTAEAAAQTAPTVPLEDYEASEQISEDLSVAFPVDI